MAGFSRAVDLPLDHNFPEPILACLALYMPDINLIPLRRVNPELTRLDDRQLMIALYQLGFLGLVTSNYKMLQNPVELAAVLKTKLVVFAIEGVGHDPIRATGALLLDLPSAVAALEAGGGGVYRLRPRRPPVKDAWELFQDAAQKRHQDPGELYEQVKVSDTELTNPVI